MSIEQQQMQQQRQMQVAALPACMGADDTWVACQVGLSSSSRGSSSVGGSGGISVHVVLPRVA
jgi:hypothetical protein